MVVVVFIPILLVRLVLIPLQDYQKQNAERIVELEKKIGVVSSLGQELQYYNQLNKRKTSELNKRVDRILKQTKLVSGSKLSVDDRASPDQKLNLSLQKINLTELSLLIYRIEHSQPVILINTMDLNPSYQNPKLFRLSLALSSE